SRRMTAGDPTLVEPRYHHRVLVVDDYPDAAEATCLLYTRFGHDCCSATTGLRALETAETFLPDIVILDLALPDLSGYEVARALRERRGRAVYLAALTGWGRPEVRARALVAGFDQHILKPASARVLRDLIVAAERSRG